MRHSCMGNDVCQYSGATGRIFGAGDSGWAVCAGMGGADGGEGNDILLHGVRHEEA